MVPLPPSLRPEVGHDYILEGTMFVDYLYTLGPNLVLSADFSASHDTILRSRGTLRKAADSRDDEPYTPGCTTRDEASEISGRNLWRT